MRVVVVVVGVVVVAVVAMRVVAVMWKLPQTEQQTMFFMNVVEISSTPYQLLVLFVPSKIHRSPFKK